MRVIFCADPLDRRRSDYMYEEEVHAAETVGIRYSLLDFESLTEQSDAERAVRQIESPSRQELGIYRGWMLRPEVYQSLYEALLDKGIQLINTPAAYKHCHYLPESYPVIERYTPQTTWLHADASVSLEAIMDTVRPFDSKPIIVKDFVKSRKHEWFEACYIPTASDRQVVERVVRRFLDLQGTDLNEGLVFREFIEFEPLAPHTKSGMPLTKEFRLFFLDGKLLYSTEYWGEGDYGDMKFPSDIFSEVARGVQSRFFTMDIARRQDKEWMIVELGDGQVAGLPDRTNVVAFYQALNESAL